LRIPFDSAYFVVVAVVVLIIVALVLTIKLYVDLDKLNAFLNRASISQFILIPNPVFQEEIFVIRIGATATTANQESRNELTMRVLLEADEQMRIAKRIDRTSLSQNYSIVFDGSVCVEDMTSPCRVLLVEEYPYKFEGTTQLTYPVPGSYGILLLTDPNNRHSAVASDQLFIHIASETESRSIELAKQSATVGIVGLASGIILQVIALFMIFYYRQGKS
jgi:hypothetical protein